MLQSEIDNVSESLGIVRRIIGISCLSISLLVLMIFQSAGAFLFLFPMFVVASIMLAPDLAGYFSGFFGNILWNSTGTYAPVYGVAETLVAKGKYAEAEEEYESIIQEFPGEVKPHIDMIIVAVKYMNNADLAERLYQRGMSLLAEDKARNTLTTRYAQIRTLVKHPDSEEPKSMEFKTAGQSGNIDPGEGTMHLP